jgi:hypothetical protein
MGMLTVVVNLCVVVLILLVSLQGTVNTSLIKLHDALRFHVDAPVGIVGVRKHYFYMRHRDGLPLPRCADLRPRPESRYAVLVEYIGSNDGYFLSALRLSVRLHWYVQAVRHETDFVLELVREEPPRVTDADVVSALRAGYDQVCHARPIHGGMYNRFVMFNMTQYESVLYIDSDVLPVNDVSDLIVNGTLALQGAGKHVMWTRERRADWFNSGVMLVLPNLIITNTLMGILSRLIASGHIRDVEPQFGLLDGGLPDINPYDQAILNNVFHAQKGDALRMPDKYNAVLFEHTAASAEVLRYAHLIHLINTKPWKEPWCYLRYNHGKICDLWFETPTVLSQDFLDIHSAYAKES